MEDIDNIIIDSLKHFKCPIEDNVTSLKQFDNDLIIKAIMCCIDIIIPGTDLPHSLPQSMSQRLKLGSVMAEHIKELGFRGDIGYQTILYCNEVEARRLLMFLVERVPREPDKSAHADDTNHVTTVVKNLRLKLQQGLKTVWVPTEVLKHGLRHTNECTLRMGYGDCVPLRCKALSIPNSQEEQSEGLKQYNTQYLHDVTKQCNHTNLLPSLLFHDSNTLDESFVQNVLKLSYHQNQWSKVTMAPKQTLITKITELTSENLDETTAETAEVITQPTKPTENDVELLKEQITSLQNELNTLELKKSKLLSVKNDQEKILSENLQQLKIKSRSHKLLSDEENLEALKNYVENDTQKLLDLSQQWQAIQEPLLKSYRELMQTVTVNESEVQNIQNRLQIAKQKSQKALEELKEKDQLHTQLSEQCAKLSKQTNRSAYTRRIMEIISNIKKQSNDINKILKDTKEVQKEINTFSGQLERSFALSDEVIFRDAKQDETARKSYKLLATMHTEYEAVGKAVTELGSIIRETRNLQEQVDNEEAREISAKLDRVMADLNQIKSETAKLISQNQFK